MTPTNQTLVLVWLVVVSQDNIQNHCEKEEKMKKMNFRVSPHNLNHLFTSDKKQGTKNQLSIVLLLRYYYLSTDIQ